MVPCIPIPPIVVQSVQEKPELGQECDLMTGLVGGNIDGRTLDETLDALWQEPWYGRERLEVGTFGLGLLHHDDHGSSSPIVWQDGSRIGAMYGTVSNSDLLEPDPGALFDRLIDRPVDLLSELNGSFLVAAADREGPFRVATDRLGSRQCFYTDRDGFRFGSEMEPALSGISTPQLDQQGLSDMLLMGHLWEDNTLIEGIRSLKPSTVVTYDEGDISTERYWVPSFEPSSPGKPYIDELVDKYRQAISTCASTMAGTVGVWLSGGLDSRSLVGELAPHATVSDEHLDLIGYTYDANPSGGGNPELAREVAATLDIDIAEVDLTPGRFLDTIERSVSITGGMVQWSTFLNLTSVFHIDSGESDEKPDIMLEGAGQGELIGNHLRHHHLRGADSVVDSLIHSEASNEVRTVCALLEDDINPLLTFKESAARSDRGSLETTVLDAHYQNYYARNTLASDQIARSQVNTRVAYLHDGLLSHVTDLPVEYRMGTVPFTDGKIPYGVTRAKLGLMRGISSELSKIPYERTNVPPSWPWVIHAVGFLGGSSLDRIRSKEAYGSWGMAGIWYREDGELRRYIDRLLDAACDRTLFNEDAVRRIQQTHLAGETDGMSVIAPLTTIELWLQSHGEVEY